MACGWVSLALLLVACGSGDPSASLVGVEISPAVVVLLPGAVQQFGASGRMSDGSTGSVAIDWSATGGTVSSGGLYTAGPTDGTYRVIAAAEGGALADTAEVTVSTPPTTLVAVELTPASATLDAGQAQQFSAVGRMSDGTTQAIAIQWGASGGTVSVGGLFIAGPTAGVFQVVAKSASGLHADTATVTVVALARVEVAPSSVTLAPSASQQFTATGHMSDGSTRTIGVTWTATGGSITSAGLYTAGAVDGSWLAIATHTGGNHADTSAVTITTPPPDIVAIEISPDSTRLTYTSTQQFTAVGRLGSGGTVPVSVTWATTTFPGNPNANTISSDGLFRAGAPIGRYMVTATQVGGSLTASVPAIAHSTTGRTASPGPAFWAPAPGIVYLCTSNHFTDDGDGRGGVATVTVSSGGGVVAPTIPYTNEGTPFTYTDGTGEVSVWCQQAWVAPVGMTGSVDVTITVASTRPGSGMAKVFTYDQPCLVTDCRAGYNQSPALNKDFTPNWATAPVSITVPVTATTGANIWFKNTYAP